MNPLAKWLGHSNAFLGMGPFCLSVGDGRGLLWIKEGEPRPRKRVAIQVPGAGVFVPEAQGMVVHGYVPGLLSYVKRIQKLKGRDAWGAQSVKRLTLGFGSGHDLTVCGFEPRVGLCADSSEPAWDCLPLSLPLLSLFLSLRQK